MGLAYRLPLLSTETTANIVSLLRIVIILTIAGSAISSRLFAVIRHESIIHEVRAALRHMQSAKRLTGSAYGSLIRGVRLLRERCAHTRRH
jgi:uncharacterized protein YbjQ (UPF0145 family)